MTFNSIAPTYMKRNEGAFVAHAVRDTSYPYVINRGISSLLISLFPVMTWQEGKETMGE